MSEETKFTPWLAIYDPFAPVVSIGDADDCPFFILKRRPDDEATVKAIINKAAASEDMYEALERVASVTAAPRSSSTEDRLYAALEALDEVRHAARKALAKARGESQ